MTQPKIGDSYERWEIQKLVDERIDAKVDAHTKEMKEFIETQFLLKLQKLDTVWSIGKFVVTTVALLALGTLYQIFLAIASSSGGGQ